MTMFAYLLTIWRLLEKIRWKYFVIGRQMEMVRVKCSHVTIDVESLLNPKPNRVKTVVES